MRDESGKFGEGNKGKPKGANNKVTQEARELFFSTLEGQVVNIEKAFDYVLANDPKGFLELFAKYAQYFIAKKTATDLTSGGDKLQTTIINLGNGVKPDEATD